MQPHKILLCAIYAIPNWLQFVGGMFAESHFLSLTMSQLYQYFALRNFGLDAAVASSLNRR